MEQKFAEPYLVVEQFRHERIEVARDILKVLDAARETSHESFNTIAELSKNCLLLEHE